MSHISHLTSTVRHVARTMVLAASGSPGVAWSQDIGPASFRDSLVMRQVAFRAPCPVPVPRAWTLVDSTLGSGLRCSLVEAAARAIAQYQQVRPPRSGPADPWNPLCVRVVVARNTGSTGLPGDWLVMFDLAADNPAYVVIDRQSGGVGAVMVGRGPPGDVPLCVQRPGGPNPAPESRHSGGV